MAASSGSTSGGSGPPPAPPKILLAKPGSVSSTGVSKFIRGDDDSAVRPRLPLGALHFLSDSWELHPDRLLPLLSDNTDFTVIGIIGPPGVGKSTILNELYGFDGSTPGMLQPFPTQSEEIRAMARHCTVGIELRISAERLMLLDTQPVFSPSVLAEMMRPDGSSAISVLNGEALSTELAHELMGIQLGVFLLSICNILLVVSEGVHDISMWNLMLTVDLLKQGIPDPSLLMGSEAGGFGHSQASNPVVDNEDRDNLLDDSGEFLADPIFIHSKLRDQDLSPHRVTRLEKTLGRYFNTSSLSGVKSGNMMKDQNNSSSTTIKKNADMGLTGPNLFVLPLKVQDDTQRAQYGSYASTLGKLRDQLLSMPGRSFAKTVSERDWLRNSARIWEMVKKSPVITEYIRTLQSSGLFRRSRDRQLTERSLGG